MMEPIRYREHSFRPDNDPVWRKRGLKTFLPRRLLDARLVELQAEKAGLASDLIPLLGRRPTGASLQLMAPSETLLFADGQLEPDHPLIRAALSQSALIGRRRRARRIRVYKVDRPKETELETNNKKNK